MTDKWCEIESDPLIFSYLLRSFGVLETEVVEMFNLKGNLQENIPYYNESVHSIYGYILLYRLPEGIINDTHENTINNTSFIAQTIPNSCATIALLNLVFSDPLKFKFKNIGDWNLYDNLLEPMTKMSSPVERGNMLLTDSVIPKIHNEFKVGVSKYLEHIQKDNNTSGRPPCHYIVYTVDANGACFEIDGLAQRIVEIGTINNHTNESFHEIVTTHINTKHNDSTELCLLSIINDRLTNVSTDIVKRSRNLSKDAIDELSGLREKEQRLIQIETADLMPLFNRVLFS